jgi:hypothetical protein
MMVKASMFPNTSFGIPWSSGQKVKLGSIHTVRIRAITHRASLRDKIV